MHRLTLLIALIAFAAIAGGGAVLSDDASAQEPPPPDTLVINLSVGWNLVAWTGPDTPIADALATVDGSFSGVFVWDPLADTFLSFSPTAPAFINTLDALKLGDGLWIKIDDPSGATWTQPDFADARSVALVPGLQLAAWTGPDAISVEEALAGLPAAVIQILTWDAAAQRFNTFNPLLPAGANSLRTFNHGDAFWIEVAQGVTWEQPASASAPAEIVPMTLTSSAFDANATIPALYTCDGAGVSPPLTITNLPQGTITLALIVDDPDAPGGTWVHWVEYNIPATTAFDEGATAIGIQGRNSFGTLGYGGPCPPSGTHRYVFKLFALDTVLVLDDAATKAQLLAAMDGNIIAQAELIGLYR